MKRRTARGFTLIEIAIVMVVIGLVLSGGLLAVAPVLQSSKVSETNAKMDRIEQALTLYVIRYGCLPCPGNPTANSVAATQTGNPGQAIATTAGNYTTGCQASSDSCANAFGHVPWRSLGLSEAETTDGFGMRIDYAISPLLFATNTMVRTPPATYPAGALTVNDTNANQITALAAYVLISHGDDRSRARRADGVLQTDPHGTATQTANGGTPPYVQDTIITNNATYFDDIVRFRTAPMIIQLCGANSCGNPA